MKYEAPSLKEKEAILLVQDAIWERQIKLFLRWELMKYFISLGTWLSNHLRPQQIASGKKRTKRSEIICFISDFPSFSNAHK